MRCWYALIGAGLLTAAWIGGGWGEATPAPAAATPAPCPITAQVAMTRVEQNAMWVALICRPANKRFFNPTLWSERKGME